MDIFRYADLNSIKKLRNVNIDMNPSRWKDLLLGKNLNAQNVDIKFETSDGDLRDYYNAHIKPTTERIEQRRANALYKTRKALLIAVPVFVVSLLLVLFATTMFGTDSYTNGVFILLLVIGLSWFLVTRPIRKYKRHVKGEIFPKIFKFFGDFSYDQKGIPSVKRFNSSKIIPIYEMEQTQDYIKGEYKNVSIEITEALLQNTIGTGKNKRVVTVFNGIFISFGVHKNFNGITAIKRDTGSVGNFFSSLGGKLTSSNLEGVKLEDPKFEKEFEVFSTDQIEARYLLTTSFMERLLKIKDEFPSMDAIERMGFSSLSYSSSRITDLQASFYENRLLIMIPSDKNRFEVGSIFKPATFEAEIKTIVREMREIFGIIDTLKLDQDIGL